MGGIDTCARIIAEESGLSFTGQRRTHLERALKRRMEAGGLRDVGGYCRLLGDSCHGAKELACLLDEVAISETSFFRHPEQFDALTVLLGPMMSLASTGGGLKVWSTCCATGEEPYSIAMLVADLGTAIRNVSVAITATDLSRRALAAAAAARYTTKAVSALPRRYRRHFTVEDDACRLHERIRRQVSFSEINLMKHSPAGAPLVKFDLIFCRNALIYFDEGAVRTVLERLAEALTDDGYLVVAPAELTLVPPDLFMAERVDRTFFLRKSHNSVGKILRARSGRWPAPTSSRKKCSTRSKVFNPQDRAAAGPDSYARILLEAARYADAGMYERTIQVCKGIPPHYSERCETYFLLGLAYCETADHPSAIQNFRKALYLEPRFALARFYLGLCCTLSGKLHDAHKQYRHVIRCLDRGPYVGALSEVFEPYSAEELRRRCEEYLAYAGKAKARS